MRRHVVVLALLALLAGFPQPAGAAASPTRAQMVGARLMVAMSGTTAPTWLLRRLRNGRVGGVILFGSNISSATQVRTLTAALRHAARAGGYPPPLIAVDQEGGAVKRISWIAPWLSPPQIGARDSTVTAYNQGAMTGAGLKNLGINVDLAPVADVPSSTRSFIYQQGRAYSMDPAVVARMARWFAVGIQSRAAAATVKHFPGLGRATVSTDVARVTISASRTALERDIGAFVPTINHGVDMVMLSSAHYTAYGGIPPGWSPTIIRGVLRRNLGFRGVTITDSLDSAAAVNGIPLPDLAVRSAGAGADVLLVTGGRTASAAVYDRLLYAARTGALPRWTLEASWARLVALRNRIG